MSAFQGRDDPFDFRQEFYRLNRLLIGRRDKPDSATIARVSVALGARGSTKIRTLTALSIDEFLAALG